MKDLAGLTIENIRDLIDHKILNGWNDERIYFPCPYSDDNEHYMIAFNTSVEQSEAYNIITKASQLEKIATSRNTRSQLEAYILLEKAAEELENCYGRETELTEEIRNFLKG